MRIRSKIIWFVLLALMLVAFWFQSHAGPTKGDGAANQMRGAKASYISAVTKQQSIPIYIQPAPTNAYYFSVKATDANGLSSEFSNELVFSKVKPSQALDMAWDASICTNRITNYTVFMGRSTTNYTLQQSAGTNLSFTWGQSRTNKVVRVTGSNLYSKTAKGDWVKVSGNPTSISVTNPSSSDMLWRGDGATATVSWQ